MIYDLNQFVSRRNNPKFAQVSGYIAKEVAMDFKIVCTSQEISQTDALEEAVKLWLEKNKSNKGVA
ncbi:MAG: hypothetical protein AAFY76_12010 [Cyanobacteria bacterium J06649_11]